MTGVVSAMEGIDLGWTGFHPEGPSLAFWAESVNQCPMAKKGRRAEAWSSSDRTTPSGKRTNGGPMKPNVLRNKASGWQDGMDHSG
jgi:hypothetical protein